LGGSDYVQAEQAQEVFMDLLKFPVPPGRAVYLNLPLLAVIMIVNRQSRAVANLLINLWGEFVDEIQVRFAENAEFIVLRLRADGGVGCINCCNHDCSFARGNS
jgi:hypothetical protein